MEPKMFNGSRQEKSKRWQHGQQKEKERDEQEEEEEEEEEVGETEKMESGFTKSRVG